jgi:hypothetical protein
MCKNPAAINIAAAVPKTDRIESAPVVAASTSSGGRKAEAIASYR